MFFEDHPDTDSEDNVTARSSVSESAEQLFHEYGVDAEAKRRQRKDERRAQIKKSVNKIDLKGYLESKRIATKRLEILEEANRLYGA
jgi:hypothetical protein